MDSIEIDPKSESEAQLVNSLLSHEYELEKDFVRRDTHVNYVTWNKSHICPKDHPDAKNFYFIHIDQDVPELEQLVMMRPSDYSCYPLDAFYFSDQTELFKRLALDVPLSRKLGQKIYLVYIRRNYDYFDNPYSFLTPCATQELAHEYIQRYRLIHSSGTYETYIGSHKDHAQFFNETQRNRKHPDITMVIEQTEI